MRRRSEIRLIAALCLACSTAFAGSPGAELVGAFTWQNPEDRFGGLSGLAISADGTSLTAIGDRGILVTAAIRRDGRQIDGIDTVRIMPILSSKGAPLDGKVADAEGLAILPDGRFCISFEKVHRVACHENLEARGRGLDRPAFFRDLPRNGGFEALAADREGRLFAIPEDVLDAEGAIPVYLWDGARWSVPYALPSRGDFLPVGADIGPDGRLYVLERDYGVMGFRSRLRRWDIASGLPRGETTLLETASGTHDNLEGVSVWRDAGGRLRATMISDDNFKFFQITEIVEYALPD